MYNLGGMASEAGDLKSAKSWFERAVELGNSDAMFELGFIADGAGDLKATKSWLEFAESVLSPREPAMARKLDEIRKGNSKPKKATVTKAKAKGKPAKKSAAKKISINKSAKNAKSWNERAESA